MTLHQLNIYEQDYSYMQVFCVSSICFQNLLGIQYFFPQTNSLKIKRNICDFFQVSILNCSLKYIYLKK